MPVPTSGVISLGKIGKEVRSSSTGNDYNEGPHTSNATTLNTAENGGYGSINTNSPDKPSASNPAKMSEWYNYQHHAS